MGLVLPQTVTGDDHAASGGALTETDANGTDNALATFVDATIECETRSLTLNTDQDTSITAAVTPTTATNTIVIIADVQTIEPASGGFTHTLKIKEGGTELGSRTDTLTTTNTVQKLPVLIVVLSNQTAAAHTYKITVRYGATTDVRYRMRLIVTQISSAAATLTGSQGTCQ